MFSHFQCAMKKLKLNHNSFFRANYVCILLHTGAAGFKPRFMLPIIS